MVGSLKILCKKTKLATVTNFTPNDSWIIEADYPCILESIHMTYDSLKKIKSITWKNENERKVQPC